MISDDWDPDDVVLTTAAIERRSAARQAIPAWSTIHNLAEAIQIADLAAKSFLFPGVTSQAAALMKILAGAEMGFGPFASLSDVHIIEGKASIGAHLRAASIRASDHYDYEIITLTRDVCELAFFERSLPSGGLTRKGRAGWVEKKEHIRLTLKEYIDCGTASDKNGKVKTNWHRTPDDMLFARAISKGYRRYCADLTGGVLSYSPEELDSEEQPAVLPAPAPASTPTVIDVTPEPRQEPAVSPTPPPLTLEQLAQEHRRAPHELSSMMIAAGMSEDRMAGDYTPAQKERLRQLIIQGQATPKHADELNAVCEQLGYTAAQRLGWLQQRYGVDSFARLTVPESEQLLAKLQTQVAAKKGG